MRYTFQYKLFTHRVQMFREQHMGIVVEKEPDVVCVYGTDEQYHIMCAVPLCHPKFLKGATYIIEFDENDRARVYIGDLQIIVDFAKKKCTNNKGFRCYGSPAWGQDVQIEWGEG